MMNGPTVLIIALFLLNIGLSIKNELDLREIERARRKRASLRSSERKESDCDWRKQFSHSIPPEENQGGEECQNH